MKSEMGVIEEITNRYAAERAKLNDFVQTMQAELQVKETEYKPRIDAAIASVAAVHAELNAAIKARAHLFQSPRTVVFFDVKVGLAKKIGSIAWSDDDEVLIARIEKMFKDDPDMLAALIGTKKSVRKEGLATLEVKDLKKLGAEVEEAGDRVVISPTTTPVDKLVRALLKSAALKKEQESAA